MYGRYSLKKYDVIRSSVISHFISHLRITRTPRRALGNLLKGLKTMKNISQTRLKPRLGQDLKPIRILFVCHGNICRSTMAQYIAQHLVTQFGMESNFYIDSAATSREEIGNPVHYGTRRKLEAEGIFCGDHRARQLKKSDYDEFDFLIGMDTQNIRNMYRILGEDPEQKVYKLLDFTERKGDIADPWYTGNFDLTYRDVLDGCRGLLKFIEEQEDFM